MLHGKPLAWKPVEWEGDADVSPVVEMRAVVGAGTYAIRRLPSGAWWARHEEPGACAWCLGDNFRDAEHAANGCEQHDAGKAWEELGLPGKIVPFGRPA